MRGVDNKIFKIYNLQLDVSKRRILLHSTLLSKRPEKATEDLSLVSAKCRFVLVKIRQPETFET